MGLFGYRSYDFLFHSIEDQSLGRHITLIPKYIRLNKESKNNLSVFLYHFF